MVPILLQAQLLALPSTQVLDQSPEQLMASLLQLRITILITFGIPQVSLLVLSLLLPPIPVMFGQRKQRHLINLGNQSPPVAMGQNLQQSFLMDQSGLPSTRVPLGKRGIQGERNGLQLPPIVMEQNSWHPYWEDTSIPRLTQVRPGAKKEIPRQEIGEWLPQAVTAQNSQRLKPMDALTLLRILVILGFDLQGQTEVG
jgi:hypothetical protein